MKFLEMIRKLTIFQKILVIASIVWILILFSSSIDNYGRFSVKLFAQGLVPFVLVWGAVWILLEIKERNRNKK